MKIFDFLLGRHAGTRPVALRTFAADVPLKDSLRALGENLRGDVAFGRHGDRLLMVISTAVAMKPGFNLEDTLAEGEARAAALSRDEGKSIKLTVMTPIIRKNTLREAKLFLGRLADGGDGEVCAMLNNVFTVAAGQTVTSYPPNGEPQVQTIAELYQDRFA